MPFILHTEELDDDPRDLPFDTKEAAIEAAVKWFEDGYDGYAETYHPDDRAAFIERLDRDSRELRIDLENGREFYCNRFYERVRISQS